MKAEVRMADDGKHLEGYALLFGSLSEPLGGFREIIDAGAVNLADDVVATFNHSMGNLLGRQSADTLELKVDKRGLFYRIDVPDTQAGRDTMTLVRRKDVSGSSFTFDTLPNGDTWHTDEKGDTLRTLKNILVHELGPVTFPAYTDTTVAARCLQAFVREQRGDSLLASAERRQRLARMTS